MLGENKPLLKSYPAHAELLVAKVAGWKIGRHRDVLFVCHYPSILQEGKPGVADC